MKFAVAVALIAAVPTACAAPTEVGEETGPTVSAPQPPSPPVPLLTAPMAPDELPEEAGPEPSPLAQLVEPLGSSRYEPPPPAPPPPTSVAIPSLGLEGAPVDEVGVEEDGSMEIPAATRVGWYRHGSRPGEEGSAVLAGHIAFDGTPGVFRDLNRVEPGDEIEVAFEDGSTRRFVVTEVVRYPKAELPFDRVFARQGPSALALVTCGGSFDRARRSYEDNVVAYAEPLSP